MSRRGFTIIEVVVASAVLLVGILVIVSSFAMNLRQATQTRSDLLAHLAMENLVEEVLEHSYGARPPASWSDTAISFPIVVEGRKVANSFTRHVAIDPKLGNGSFYGRGSGNTDYVALEVRWTEASGEGNRAEAKSLAVNLTVVRKP